MYVKTDALEAAIADDLRGYMIQQQVYNFPDGSNHSIEVRKQAPIRNTLLVANVTFAINCYDRPKPWKHTT